MTIHKICKLLHWKKNIFLQVVGFWKVTCLWKGQRLVVNKFHLKMSEFQRLLFKELHNKSNDDRCGGNSSRGCFFKEFLVSGCKGAFHIYLKIKLSHWEFVLKLIKYEFCTINSTLIYSCYKYSNIWVNWMYCALGIMKFLCVNECWILLRFMHNKFCFYYFPQRILYDETTIVAAMTLMYVYTFILLLQ